MECYKSNDLDINKFHVLDYNFDRAYIYNTEQVSGEFKKFSKAFDSKKQKLGKFKKFPVRFYCKVKKTQNI